MKRIALAAAAIATGVGTFFLVRLAREDGSPGIARPESGQDAGQKSPGPPIPPPATGQPDAGQLAGQPGQPDAGQPGPPPPRSFTFEDETRDPAWADEQEKEMTLRLRTIIDRLTRDGAVVNVDSIECRRSLCRITLHAGDVPSLSKAYGVFESPEGLYGWADNVLLESVETESDGTVKTRVTAVFDRD